MYIGLDSFAQRNFIADKAVKKLNLRVYKSERPVHISGLSKTNQETHLISSKYTIINLNNKSMQLNIVPSCAPRLPSVDYSIQDLWPKLSGQKLSTDFPRREINLDLLIGLPDFMNFVRK